jgi:glycosyltransferase involved in cell wall biosynthesis
LKWFYNQADLSVVPSKDTKNELNSLGFENLEIWARGINTEKFSPKFADASLRQQWSPHGKPIVLFVGRLVREKDVDTLIDAIRILQTKEISHQMVFVGGGPLRKDIAAKLPGTMLTGHLEGEALSKAYASADIFAFPSTTETFGNVILEAAASGLPSVGARAGGIKNVIKDKETGYLSDPRDPGDFAKKLEKLLIDDKLRKTMSEKAIANSSKFNIDEVNLGLVDKYKRLIDKYHYEYQNPDLFSIN